MWLERWKMFWKRLLIIFSNSAILFSSNLIIFSNFSILFSVGSFGKRIDIISSVLPSLKSNIFQLPPEFSITLMDLHIPSVSFLEAARASVCVCPSYFANAFMNEFAFVLLINGIVAGISVGSIFKCWGYYIIFWIDDTINISIIFSISQSWILKVVLILWYTIPLLIL